MNYKNKIVPPYGIAPPTHILAIGGVANCGGLLALTPSQALGRDLT